MKGIKISDLDKLSYREIEKIDLVNNKKQALFVNIASFVIILFMMVFIPLLLKAGIIRRTKTNLFLSLIVFVVSLILYIPLHELVHGIVLRCFTDEKLSFGWKLVYAYCGSKEAVIKRGEYYLVALAPLVVFSFLFIALMALNPTLSYVWYLLEIMNVSGSIGDIYVSIKLMRIKNKDIVITDSGTAMSFWSR